jgi:hypothetical protein
MLVAISLPDVTLRAVLAEFPTLAVFSGRASLPSVAIDAEALFSSRALETRLRALDAAGPFALELAARDERAALRVLTRYQRFVRRTNRFSDGPRFRELLAGHRALYDLDKPATVAELDRALDRHQWLLRLAPEASLATQLAALFGDVDRLLSAAELRPEPHGAADGRRGSRAHLRAGAQLVRRTLAGLVPPPVLERALQLIAADESLGADPDRVRLDDADALSYFSLTSDRFLDQYGVAHSARKIRYSLARLSPEGVACLANLALRPDVARLLDEATIEPTPEATTRDDVGLAGRP